MTPTEMEFVITGVFLRVIDALRQTQKLEQAHDELLTVKDVAKVLHIGINAANTLVQSGIIPHINLNGAKVRRRALEAWMASMEGKDLSDPANPVLLEDVKEFIGRMEHGQTH